jgi:hypothetical protein
VSGETLSISTPTGYLNPTRRTFRALDRPGTF